MYRTKLPHHTGICTVCIKLPCQMRICASCMKLRRHMGSCSNISSHMGLTTNLGYICYWEIRSSTPKQQPTPTAWPSSVPFCSLFAGKRFGLRAERERTGRGSEQHKGRERMMSARPRRSEIDYHWEEMTFWKKEEEERFLGEWLRDGHANVNRGTKRNVLRGFY